MSESIIFLQGPHVTLRPICEADAPLLSRWINDPKVRQYLLNVWPLTTAYEVSWIQGLSGKQVQDIVFVIEVDGTPIGTNGIHRVDYINGVAGTGALIGEVEYWGKGFGSEAKMLQLYYAFNTLGLRKINSTVLSFNMRSKAYLERCGYREEGCARKQIYRSGEYWDLHHMAVFREDWIPLWNAFAEAHGDSIQV